MFDVSFSELLLILVVGLLVFGPEKLPQVVRSVSLWLSRARRTFNQIRSEIEREVGVEELKRDLHNQAIMDTFKDVHKDLNQTRQDLQHLPFEVSDVVRRNLDPAAGTPADPAPSIAPPTPSVAATPETTTVQEQSHTEQENRPA